MIAPAPATDDLIFDTVHSATELVTAAERQLIVAGDGLSPTQYCDPTNSCRDVNNRDQEIAHSVNIAFTEGEDRKISSFHGKVDVIAFGEPQYQWHPVLISPISNPESECPAEARGRFAFCGFHRLSLSNRYGWICSIRSK